MKCVTGNLLLIGGVLLGGLPGAGCGDHCCPPKFLTPQVDLDGGSPQGGKVHDAMAVGSRRRGSYSWKEPVPPAAWNAAKFVRLWASD
jgi:hypothetical protein